MAEARLRKSTKESSAEEVVHTLKIVILITKIGNLKNFENGEKSEFEISLKYLGFFLNCKNVDDLSEETNRFKILRNHDEESVNLEYKLQIKLKNEDIFDLAGHPVELCLIQHQKDSQKSILGYSNLDLYPLVTKQIEKREFRLNFERDEDPENLLPLFRKPYIELTVSADEPIIQEPNTFVNSMMITVDSICNLSSKCSSIEVGFIVPFEAKFSKKIIFSNPQHCGSNKKWLNLSHIYGKGGDSSFIESSLKHHLKKQEKEMMENITVEDTIQFNSIARAILSHESVIFLYDHIRLNKKMAVEVTVEGKHLIGFIDLEELIHVNRKKIHTAVPLTQFNEIALLNNCGYPSAFEGFNKSSISKKSISSKKLRNTKSSTVDDDTQPVTSEIICNAEGNPTFVILEIEFEKPLNEEVFVELDMFLAEKPGSAIEPDEKSNHQRNKLLAKIYHYLKIEERSIEIYLKQMIDENCSEASWINYGIHFLRSQKFNKACVCFEECLEINDKSLMGNILKAYISFKQQKYNECERLLNFVMHLNPGLLELEFMKHLVIMKLSREDIPVHMKEFKSHQDFDEIYNEQEVLWFSTPGNSFLNFQNNFIKFAIFSIKLGCYEYAELALAEYFLHFGANVNYLYLMAVIDAMRFEDENALIHLNKISKMDIGNHAVNVCGKNL
ncbi:unnamed protein product [Diamesa hyperborea]